MIHTGNHRSDGLAVGKAQDGNFRSLQKLFDDDGVARFPKDLFGHHIVDGGLRFLVVCGDDDALAERQTVRLNDDGERALLQVRKRGLLLRKDLVLCGGDAVTAHQVLGKAFASLDDRRFCVGSETRNAGFGQFVHRAEDQRIVGRDDGVIDLVFDGKINDCGDVLCADVHAGGIHSDAAVAGQGKDFGHRRILLYRSYDGVLSASASDHQYFHFLLPFINGGKGAFP